MVDTIVTNSKRVIVARMKRGEDILKTIERVVEKHDVKSGQLTLIGAVSRIKLGYFSVEENQYKDFSLEQDLEVVSCAGNISTLRDGSIVVHAHMVVADENGRCYGGHLMEGCIVSVTIELHLFEVEAQIFRGKDESTGLNLMQL